MLVGGKRWRRDHSRTSRERRRENRRRRKWVTKQYGFAKQLLAGHYPRSLKPLDQRRVELPQFVLGPVEINELLGEEAAAEFLDSWDQDLTEILIQRLFIAEVAARVIRFRYGPPDLI